MAKARVTLIGCASFSRKGQFWRMRETQIITELERIRYFQALPEFEVKLLDRRGWKEPDPSQEVDLEPVAEEPLPELNLDVTPDPKTSQGNRHFSASRLRKETKASLVEIARVQYRLKLNPEKPKELLVGQILAAQRIALENANKKEA